MRRRPTSRRRRGPRRLTDWIPCHQGLTADNVTTDPLTSTLESWITLTDMDEHVDRMTVVRLVGHVGFVGRFSESGNGPGAAFISWGVYKAQSDDAGAVITMDASDLTDAQSEDWLYRRTVVLGGLGTGSVAGAASVISHEDMLFDTHVMRKLEGRQQLIFVATISFSIDFPATISCYQNVRALVKLA